MSDVVMVRASQGEPLRRIPIWSNRDVVYLANPDLIAAVEAGDSSPIGFPIDDVYAYDAGIFEQLTGQWGRDGRTENGLWEKAPHYHPPR